jgi:DsbC/DsbD-like thiol-disulfide interchange protein
MPQSKSGPARIGGRDGRTRWRRAAAAFGVTLALGLPAAAQAPAVSLAGTAARRVAARHVTVDLISDRDALAAGEQWIAVRFTLDPEWHIYWLNPGDSGGPPEMSWTLPAGVTAAPALWPRPQRIEAGGLVNYGYFGTVVLPVRLSVLPGQAGSPVVIRASLRWLVCHQMCLSGSASLALSLPLDGADRAKAAEWAGAIQAARALVPAPAPAAWRATATSTADAFEIELITGRPESSGIFFPLDPSQIDDSALQSLTPLPAGLTLKLRKSPQLIQDPPTLRGIVSFPDGRTVEVSARVSR